MYRSTFKEYLLLEATFDIDDIVDLIYEKWFAKYFKAIKPWVNGETLSTAPRLDQPESLQPFMVQWLFEKNKAASVALELNPINITFNKEAGNYYIPKEHTNSGIGNVNLTINVNVYNMLMDYIARGTSYSDFINMFPSDKQVQLKGEISGNVVKSSIAHEISHWLRDSNHDGQITKLLSKAKESSESGSLQSRKKVMNRGLPDTYMTDYEIDAFIHGLKTIKKRHSEKEWNKLTFNELLNQYPGMATTKDRLKTLSKETVQQWYKSISSRLAREGLLGQNMKRFTI